MLTQRQSDALRAIRQFSEVHGHSPTVREIQLAVGHSSPSSTYRLLQQLKAKGLITWKPRTYRTLRVRSGDTSR